MGPVAAPPLPDQKTKGWEFTDLSGLDLEAYAAAEGEVEGLGAESASLDGPVVMPLAAAAEQFPELVEPRLGSLVPADDPFVARNDAAPGPRAPSSTSRRGKRLEQPVQSRCASSATAAHSTGAP